MTAGLQPPTIEDMRSLCRRGQFDLAAMTGWSALRSDPRDPELLKLLSLAEHRRGNNEAALVLLRRASIAAPREVGVWNDLGSVCLLVGELDEAEGAYSSALSLDAGCAETYNNLAVLMSKRGEHCAARELLDRALALKPQYSDALYNMGNALAGLGKFQRASRRYEQACELNEEHPGTHFNLGITRMILGDLTNGWPEWEWRWRATLAPFRRNFPQPAWTGEMLYGQRLLLYAEQGVGDTIQFMRYLPMVAAKGARILLEVQRPLLPLMQKYPDVEQVIARGDELPEFDLHCSLMSLGWVFGTTLAAIPPAVLSFSGAAASCERSAGSPLRVGLVWAGNPTHERDRDRSLALTEFQSLLELNNVKWFSLQKGEAAKQLTGWPAQICDLAGSFNDYADTTRALNTLDLVISVDTSVAHLAGAMGKPVWILLPAIPDWRWLLKRRDSPWYPTARLFRRDEGGEWSGVIRRVRDELARLAAPS